MTITSKTVNNFGYISITIMMALLLLLWFRVVPESFTVPFFVIALGLFLTRIFLRIKLAQIERQTLQANKQQPPPAQSVEHDN
ncbi:MAG: hypothetical protein AAB344_00775 [Bacteroidota bacterium]